ncbi:MAG: Tol-Pal system beta propeller repeat protein TolB [Gammaproteobacteria bacterium]|nr:Tol-Pal system beta propeller repeat protein TolB [Gammaproteobacteria bacterium]
MILRNLIGLVGFGLTLAFSTATFAESKFVIRGAADNAIPVAVAPFRFNGMQVPSENLARVIGDDLRRTGQFTPKADAEMPQAPSTAAEVDYGRWRQAAVDYLVVGQVNELGPDQYEVRFELVDVFGRQGGAGLLQGGQLMTGGTNVLEARVARIGGDAFRRYAHQISDVVYEKLTGVRGAFSTRLAYVQVEMNLRDAYQLFVADYDGSNPQRVRASRMPIMSPSWSPDGQKLAYVTFENRRSEVVIHSIYQNQRQVVANFKGINGAPEWSPDGRSLALVLSKDGNPDIYLMDLASRSLRRVTNTPAIETEPSFSPDGQTLYFTSDRGGRPQVYSTSLASGATQRVTFTGIYNASPSLSRDGKKMVLLHRDNTGFKIASQDLASGQISVLTETSLDESPTVAPNGSMVIHATSLGRNRILNLVSANGRYRSKLLFGRGDLRSPAWSPFLN